MDVGRSSFAIDRNTSNFLMRLGRHHMKQYAELIKVATGEGITK